MMDIRDAADAGDIGTWGAADFGVRGADATAAAIAIFVALLWFTRRHERLSAALFGFTLAEMIVVILWYTTQFNNVVIVKDIAAQVIGYTMILLWAAHWPGPGALMRPASAGVGDAGTWGRGAADPGTSALGAPDALMRRGGFCLSPTPMNRAVLVFLLASVLSAIVTPGQFRHAALIRVSLLAAVILTFFVIVNFFHTRRRWLAGVYTLVGLMALTATYSVMQERGYDFINWGRLVNVSTFGNVQFFAAFLTYTAPLAIFLALGAGDWISKIILSISVLVIADLVHIRMRGGYLSLMMLGILVIYFELRYGRLRQMLGTRRMRWMGWTAAAVLGIFLYSSYTDRIDRMFEYIFYNNEGFHSIRTLRMTGGMMMGWDSPLTGHGIGTFHAIFPYYRDGQYHRVGLSHNSDSPASLIVTLFSEQGLLGLSAFMAVMVVFFVCMIRRIRNTRDMNERYTGFGVMAAILCGWTNDSVTHSYLWMTSMLTFWVLLALGTRWMMGLEEAPGAPEVSETIPSPAYTELLPPELQIPPDRPADVRDIGTWGAADSGGRGADPAGVGDAGTWGAGGADPAETLPAERVMDFRQGLLLLCLVVVFGFMFWGEYRVLSGDRLLKRCEDSGGGDAVAACEMTIDRHPYAHSGYYKLAYHQLNANDVKSALESYEGLLAIAPNYAQVHQNTGLIYYRMFGRAKEKKYLHQSILEFEWSTILENSLENHTKMMQLYVQLQKDIGRGRYHNQFLWWIVQEDMFLNQSRYWAVAGDPGQSGSRRHRAREGWIEDLEKSRLDYWLFRADSVRRIGRPVEELRYAVKMAMRYGPDNSALRQIWAEVGRSQPIPK